MFADDRARTVPNEQARILEPNSKLGYARREGALRRNMRRMDAMKIHAPALAMVASKSLASRGQRPSQAKVRSTTHRRGSTSKPWPRRRARCFRWSTCLGRQGPVSVFLRRSRRRRTDGAATDRAVEMEAMTRTAPSLSWVGRIVHLPDAPRCR